MTDEERMAKIEHVTATLLEQRKQDREESRQLWRQTQLQLNELTLNVAALGDRIGTLADESRAADERLGQRIEETNQNLAARIESLVSGMGKFIASRSPEEGR
jgi:hypothetical protein